MDHRTLHKGGTLRMTIRCYVDEVLSTPTSITVTSYLNGSATGDTITPSVDALGTGLSTITYTPSGTAAGDTLTLKISQTVSGTTRVTTVDVLIVAEPDSGVGPYAVTVRTVDPAGNPVAAARVRLSRAGQERTADTDADGESLLSCAAATWTVTISADGYVFTPVALSVSADTEIEYELSDLALEVSEAGKVTGWTYVYDADGVLDPGQEVSLKTVRSTVSSGVYAGAIRTVAANDSGLVQFTNLFPGNTYAVKYGEGEWCNVEIPSTATVSHPIGRAIGPE